MALLDFIKYRNSKVPHRPAPDRPTSLTERGNPIASLQTTTWKLDQNDLCITRTHVGQSKEGFHGGVEVVWKDGKENMFWTNARSDKGAAEKASGKLYSAWYRGERLRVNRAPKVEVLGNQNTIKRARPSWER